MAAPKTASGNKFIVLLGNGAGTEVFTAPCGITTKGINFSADTTDQTVPDCDTPDDPAWIARTINTLSAGITGSGLLALEALPTWRAFFFNGVSKNCRAKIDVPLVDNGGYFAGAFLCTALNIGGTRGAKISLDTVTLVSDGPVTWVAASA